jgi:hypothetical protein
LVAQSKELVQKQLELLLAEECISKLRNLLQETGSTVLSELKILQLELKSSSSLLISENVSAIVADTKQQFLNYYIRSNESSKWKSAQTTPEFVPKPIDTEKCEVSSTDSLRLPSKPSLINESSSTDTAEMTVLLYPWKLISSVLMMAAFLLFVVFPVPSSQVTISSSVFRILHIVLISNISSHLFPGGNLIQEDAGCWECQRSLFFPK